MIEVPKDVLTVKQIRLGVTGLPLVVPLSGTNFAFTVNQFVPAAEYWIVIGAGLVVVTDDSRVTVIGAVASITPSLGIIEETPATLTQLQTPWNVPIQVAQQTTVNWGLSISLQGVELSEGDRFNLQVLFANSDAVAAHNVTSMTGAIRVKPLKLVSEPAVARLNDGRQDFLLDQRLRAARG